MTLARNDARMWRSISLLVIGVCLGAVGMWAVGLPTQGTSPVSSDVELVADDELPVSAPEPLLLGWSDSKTFEFEIDDPWAEDPTPVSGTLDWSKQLGDSPSPKETVEEEDRESRKSSFRKDHSPKRFVHTLLRDSQDKIIVKRVDLNALEFDDRAYEERTYAVCRLVPRELFGMDRPQNSHLPIEWGLPEAMESFLKRTHDDAWDPKRTLLAWDDATSVVLIRQSERVLREFEAYLDELDQPEVKALALKFVPLPDATGDARPLILDAPWQSSTTAYRGEQFTYLQDYDAEVTMGGVSLNGPYYGAARHGTWLRATWSRAQSEILGSLRVQVLHSSVAPKFNRMSLPCFRGPFLGLDMPQLIEIEYFADDPSEWSEQVLVQDGLSIPVSMNGSLFGRVHVNLNRAVASRSWRRITKADMERHARERLPDRIHSGLEVRLKGSLSGPLGHSRGVFPKYGQFGIWGLRQESTAWSEFLKPMLVPDVNGYSKFGLPNARGLCLCAGHVLVQASCVDPFEERATIDLVLTATEWSGATRRVPIRHTGDNWRRMTTIELPSSYAFSASRSFDLRKGETRILKFAAELGKGPEQLELTVTRVRAKER